jgi:two-component system sensor histidine kinase DctS
MHGTVRRGSRLFTSQQLLDLPGNTLVLRMDSWRSGARPVSQRAHGAGHGHVHRAGVGAGAAGKDMPASPAAERDLAEALAFRKAMEDSLVTGLRARDLQGNITYVNPAFCQMVGFARKSCWATRVPAPYWPPELADEYRQRQAIRLEPASMRRRARAWSRCSCARTVRAFRCSSSRRP